MDRLSAFVVAAALLCGVSIAHARYVSPTPPSGFAPGSGGGFVYTPPTPLEQLDSIRKESASSKGNWYKTPGPTLPGGGGKPPSAMRFGPGAARALAGAAARGLIPGLGLALGLAWLAQHCIGKTDGGTFYNKCVPGGGGTVSDGFEYKGGNTSIWHKSLEAAANDQLAFERSRQNPDLQLLAGLQTSSTGSPFYAWVVYSTRSGAAQPWVVRNAQYGLSITRRASACQSGWTVTSSGDCVQFPEIVPMTPQEVEDHMELKPLPNVLPAFVPYPLWSPEDGAGLGNIFPHPVVVNPNRQYSDDLTPMPQTWRQPQGSPKLNPQTGKVEQPVTDWKHKPTKADPHQMEAEPGTAEPQPGEEEQTEPGTTEETETGNGKPPSTPTDTPDLCEKNPGILACQDMDQPGEEDLETIERGGVITPDGGWGSQSASCPPPRMLTVQGRPIPIPFDMFCMYMEGLRPVILAMAWLSAAFILVGAIRTGD